MKVPDGLRKYDRLTHTYSYNIIELPAHPDVYPLALVHSAKGSMTERII